MGDLGPGDSRPFRRTAYRGLDRSLHEMYIGVVKALDEQLNSLYASREVNSRRPAYARA